MLRFVCCGNFVGRFRIVSVRSIPSECPSQSVYPGMIIVLIERLFVRPVWGLAFRWGLTGRFRAVFVWRGQTIDRSIPTATIITVPWFSPWTDPLSFVLTHTHTRTHAPLTMQSS